MKTIVWLDDVRNPASQLWKLQYPDLEDNKVIWLKSFKEFKTYIDEGHWMDKIYFDHDLGKLETGYDAAKYLISHMETKNNPDLELPEFWSQSSNPVGKENILKLLENYSKFLTMKYL